MSIHLPPSDLPRADEAASDAKKSVRGRMTVGVCLILVGMALAQALARAYEQNSSYIVTQSEIDKGKLIVIDAQNVFFVLAQIACGCWNITARRSNLKNPLIVALLLAGVGLVLAAMNTVDALTAAAEMPNALAVLFLLVILVQAIRVLRLKPINPLLFYLP